MPKGITVGEKRSKTVEGTPGTFMGSSKAGIPSPNLDQASGGVTKGPNESFARITNGYNDRGNGGPT